MDERVKIVHLGIFGGGEEGEEVERPRRRVEFDGRGGAAANDYYGTVGEDLIGGVPSADGEERGVELAPVAGEVRGARREGAEAAEAVEVAAGLE